MKIPKSYIFWIIVALAIFFTLAYFFPILPCKVEHIRDIPACTDQTPINEDCIIYEGQAADRWERCNLKKIITFEKAKEGRQVTIT